MYMYITSSLDLEHQPHQTLIYQPDQNQIKIKIKPKPQQPPSPPPPAAPAHTRPRASVPSGSASSRPTGSPRTEARRATRRSAAPRRWRSSCRQGAGPSRSPGRRGCGWRGRGLGRWGCYDNNRLVRGFWKGEGWDWIVGNLRAAIRQCHHPGLEGGGAPFERCDAGAEGEAFECFWSFEDR